MSDNDTLDQMTDVMFFVDMLITFNTGIYKNAVLIMNRKIIILEYFKTGFWVDVISTFPYTYIIIWITEDIPDASTNESVLTLMQILRFMRFFKLLRILKIRRIKTKYEEIFYNDKFDMFTLFLKILALTFYFAHTIACFFWLVGNSLLERDQDVFDKELSWIVR
jgi:hypothetical protein